MKNIKCKKTVLLLIEDETNIIHKINGICIHKYNGSYKVLNPDSGFIHFFNDESIAINFCLDNYEATKKNTICKLF